jgi:outer membrane protein OmpA-like peptidoglycan-associated protein
LAKSPVGPESGPVSDDQERQDVLEMEELRRLIAGRERSQIDQLRERLENPELRIKDVSQILAEAIVHRTSQDEKIAKALAPTVEKAIESSIKRNRKVLVDVLFPVMGPAIRKAVASAIHGMVQSFDKTLEYSLSLRGLRWRFEALRTRKPFGEIVLLHTLLYQVEQIFLIHRKSSLVIQHVVSKNVKSHDPDLVAGMLSAIRDFAQDSFSLGKEEGLDTLSLGPDRTIWVEQGAHALLAAVIRGIPPSKLRTTLRETLETIHFGHGEALEAFDGDSAPFETVRTDLEDCLQTGYKPKKKRAFPVFWALLGAALALIIILGFFSIRGHRRWQNYLEGLKDVPGIQITSGEKRSGLYHVYGFRDPLAQNPADLLKKGKLQPEKFVFHLESYTSTHPQIILKRFQQILESPETVHLEFKDDVLLISGSSPHAWIAKMREALKAMPGLSRADDSQLEDLDLRNFEALREKLEQRYFLFEFDSADMIKGQEPEFQAFAADLKNLLNIAKGLEKSVQIEIVGHADSLGTESGNLILSQERARKILAILLKEGFDAKGFLTTGLGSREPLKEEKTDQDRELNRRVMIRIK